AGAWQHVGFADDGFVFRYAILSTYEGGGLYARTFDGAAETLTEVPGVSLGGYHDVRIVWGASSVDYYVDGAPAAHHPVAISAADNLSWSDWAPVPANGGAIGSPPGRYLQYRATLTSSATDSPRLDLVSVTTAPPP